jgi:predicted ATP-dependent endonuclease of OLD family
MILKSYRVTDFKSITDSGEIRVDDKITALVGKNESGKTACLEALYRLNPVPTGHPDTFEALRDFPRARY